MSNKEQHLEALHEIKDMMNKSSRFISLSGLSGILCGVYALAAAIFSYYYLLENNISPYAPNQFTYEAIFVLGGVAVGTLFLTLITSFVLTIKKAQKEKVNLWDATAFRLTINLAIPVIIGGIFCLSLLQYRGTMGFIAPSMLIFYGLGLINASKYTYHQLRHLGILEVILGLISLQFIGYGILFWAIGFGVLHIVYGALMYFKYERK